MWEAAQLVRAERGNVRDTETDTSQPGRRYVLRARIRCAQCQRRVHVRETTLAAAITGFLRERVFGPDRAAMLAAQLPATAADAARNAEARAAALRQQIGRVEPAEQALITELETLGTSPAATAYRTRIRDRFTQLFDQRTQAQNELDQLIATAAGTPDPALLDELPDALALLTEAPDHIREQLYAALDIQALYRHDKQQVTIWATITDATPDTIRALLADPRTDTDASAPSHPNSFGELAAVPIAPQTTYRRGWAPRGLMRENTGVLIRPRRTSDIAACADLVRDVHALYESRGRQDP